MVYTIILLVADWTLFCDFTRKQLPARKVIFVAQLGRKFRLFSLTVQRYNLFIAVYESRANIFLVFLRKRQPNLLRVAVLQFSKGFPILQNLLLYQQCGPYVHYDGHGSNSSSSSVHACWRESREPLGAGPPGFDTPKPNRRIGREWRSSESS